MERPKSGQALSCISLFCIPYFCISVVYSREVPSSKHGFIQILPLLFTKSCPLTELARPNCSFQTWCLEIWHRAWSFLKILLYMIQKVSFEDVSKFIWMKKIIIEKQCFRGAPAIIKSGRQGSWMNSFLGSVCRHFVAMESLIGR